MAIKFITFTERFLRSIAQTEAKRKYQILSRTIKTINKKYPEDGLESEGGGPDRGGGGGDKLRLKILKKKKGCEKKEEKKKNVD